MSKRKRLSRRQAWFFLFFLLSLLIALSLSAIVGNSGGKFDGKAFAITMAVTMAVFIAAYIVLSLPVVKGRIGEARVNGVLKGLSKKYGGHFIHDVMVKDEEGKTSQIDHVYVCQKGVFVIETKNYAGRIYGSRDSKQWTQTLAHGHSKNKLYNPVMQNYTHIKRLKEALSEEVEMVSAVVFVRGNIDYIESDGVYDLNGLRDLVDKSDFGYSEEKVELIASEIQSYKDNPVASKVEHVKRIKDKKEGIKEGVCPRCGGELVLRTSKKDGRQFYGCSNFPSCKFTLPIE